MVYFGCRRAHSVVGVSRAFRGRCRRTCPQASVADLLFPPTLLSLSPLPVGSGVVKSPARGWGVGGGAPGSVRRPQGGKGRATCLTESQCGFVLSLSKIRASCGFTSRQSNDVLGNSIRVGGGGEKDEKVEKEEGEGQEFDPEEEEEEGPEEEEEEELEDEEDEA